MEWWYEQRKKRTKRVNGLIDRLVLCRFKDLGRVRGDFVGGARGERALIFFTVAAKAHASCASAIQSEIEIC